MTVKTFTRIVKWTGIVLCGGSDVLALSLFLIGHWWAVPLMMLGQLGGAILMMAIIFEDEDKQLQV